jgi:hypothetical protein
MTIKVGEKGQPFRIATGFDMSGSTVLSIVFVAPTNGTSFTKTNATTPAVTAPAVTLTNDPGFTPAQTVPASTYFEYITDGTEFDVSGQWTACAVYADASVTLNANKVTFTIGGSCSN